MKGETIMAKRENEFYTQDRNIQIANIGDLCTEHMQIFGANTNLMRHIPSLADGLKPGERRILYAMYKDLKALPDRNTIKVARITGEVIGKYHPHGDAPVYETLVKLSQSWNNLQPLIHGKGNFGSQKGEPAAAPRYIEAKLSKYAFKCFFEEFDINYINTKPNFLGDIVEPEYLPSRYPNVLISNTFGIGYGMSTGMPTYNLREVLELTIKLMDDPDYDDVTLIPDSPTKAHIIDEGQFKEISETGKGKFRMRGQIDIDDEKNELIIRSVPLQVSSNPIKNDIIDLYEENKIQGIIGISDDSSKQKGIKLHIHLKKEIDPVSVMHMIYTKTQMEKTFPVNFKLIDDYQDFDYNIRTLLIDWIDFRRETKRIQYNYRLIEAKERQHILEIILHVLAGKNGEKTLEVIRKAESRDEVVQYLMKTFKITSLQAKTIADMRLSTFSKEGIKRLKKEKEEVDEKVKKYDKIIRSNKKIDKIIREELEEGIQLFGEDRRSKIISVDGEVKIRDTEHVVVFTMNGLVKKLPADTGSIGAIAQGDYPIEIIKVSNLTDLLIFDETGKISKVPVHLLTNIELNSEGEKLSKYATVNGKIAAIIPKPTVESLEKLKVPVYFTMVTKKGLIKKTEASNYINIKNELLGLIIKEGDELQTVKLVLGVKEGIDTKDVLVYTNKGFGIRFPINTVKETNRMSIGVKALDLTKNEVVIGMDIVNDKDKYIFVLSNKGNGKKCTLDAFKTMDRAGKSLRITALESDEEVMLMRTVKGNEKFKAYLKSSIEDINIEEVLELPRLSKGKKILPVRKGENIIDIKEVK
jgi:DNA gyrase subunit A